MSYEEALSPISATAATDLSGDQYRFLTMANQAGQGMVQRATTGNPVMGVLQNKPVAGLAATIAVGGTSKVVCGGTITAGQQVTTDAQGRATATIGGTDYRCGVARESGVVGQIIAVQLTLAGIGLT